MQYREFIKKVKERGAFETEDEALQAVAATLITLAERLAGGEAKDLAAQLPRELTIYLVQDGAGAGERLSLEEFFARVSAREEVDTALCVAHTQAVLSVVREAISAGEMRDVIAQLPNEFLKLFAPVKSDDPRL